MRFIRKARSAPSESLLTEAADKLRPKIAQAFYDTVLRVRAEISVPKLNAALRQSIVAADDYLNLEERFASALNGRGLSAEQTSFLDTLQETFRAGAQAEIKELESVPLPVGFGKALTRSVGYQLQFGYVDPEAVAFLEQYSFRLIREISQTTRDAIQDTLLRAFRSDEGLSVFQQARRIRSGGIISSIGLTTNQANAVTNFRAALQAGDYERALSRALRDKRFDPRLRRLARIGGQLSPAQVDQMTQRYFERYLKYRSETIARTESIRAATVGQQAVWNSAREQKLLPADAKKYWIVSRDERTCPICRGIASRYIQGVPLDGSFDTGVGRGSIPHPPAHPDCRCAVALHRGKKITPKPQPSAPTLRPTPPPLPPRPLDFAARFDRTRQALDELFAKNLAEVGELDIEVRRARTAYGRALRKVYGKDVDAPPAGAREALAEADKKLQVVLAKRAKVERAAQESIFKTLNEEAGIKRGEVHFIPDKRPVGTVIHVEGDTYRIERMTSDLHTRLNEARAFVERTTGAKVDMRFHVVTDAASGDLRECAVNYKPSTSDLSGIYISPNTPTRTIVHEMFHMISGEHRAAHIDTLGVWWRGRTAGEAAVRLSDVTGNIGYSPTERTHKDKFWSPYIGKIYSPTQLPGEEASSMAGELAYASGLDQLSRADYGHFEAFLRFLIRVSDKRP